MAAYVNALPKGTVLTAGAAYTYVIERVLGQGGFGITYLAAATPRRGGAPMKVALKEFFMNTTTNTSSRSGQTVTAGTSSIEQFERYRRKFTNEADKLKRLRNSRIIKVYEQFDANGTSYYSMEYMANGNLNEYIAAHGPLSEARAIHFARQIADGLGHMHANHMLHLDLKPGNIMMKDSDNLVIIDFGLSKVLNDDGRAESSSIVSGRSMYYAPPEQPNYRFVEGVFPATLDIYAVGAIVYKMLTKLSPPEDILNDGFPRSSIRASREMIDLVEHAMKPRYKERVQTVAEFVRKLEALPAAKTPKPATTPAPKPATATKPAATPAPKPAPTPKPAAIKVPFCVNCGYKFEDDGHRYCIICGNERMQFK